MSALSAYLPGCLFQCRLPAAGAAEFVYLGSNGRFDAGALAAHVDFRTHLHGHGRSGDLGWDVEHPETGCRFRVEARAERQANGDFLVTGLFLPASEERVSVIHGAPQPTHDLELEADLRAALDSGALSIAYQPIIDMRSEALAGLEALSRWIHPTRGFVSPAEFIPVAESSGLIVQLGNWILESALWQFREWQGLGLPADAFITVNVSGRQLMRGDFEGTVRSILEKTGFDPHCLKLEVTETLMVTSSHESVEALGNLRELGIRIALDDFGTGYSSIGALRNLPIDTLKLDRSFTAMAGTESSDISIIRAILHIAEALGVDVVAEGIENRDQFIHLRMLGCELAQGFLFSKPLSPEQVEHRIGEDPIKFAA